MRQLVNSRDAPHGKSMAAILPNVPKKATVDMPTRERIAAFLRYYMSRLGLNGRQMARKLGVHEGTISKVLSVSRTPGLDFFIAMSRKLSIDPARLLNEGPEDKRYFQPGSEQLPPPSR